MHRIRGLLLFASFFVLIRAATAQIITVKDLMQAGSCRDLACFTRFAVQKGFAPADTITEEGHTTVVFLPRRAGADDLSPELGITMGQGISGSVSIPSVYYACYDAITYQRLLSELTAMGFEAEEPVDVGAGLMTDYTAPDRPELNVWTLTAEMEIGTGTVTYYKLGLAKLE